MGFRHDTRHLSPQQQAIIRQRDEEEASRKRESDKKKQELEQEQEEIQDAIEKIDTLLNEGFVFKNSIEDGIKLIVNFNNLENGENRKLEFKGKNIVQEVRKKLNII